MFSFIIHRSVIALTLVLALVGQSYAAVLIFAGAETGDASITSTPPQISECPARITNATIGADSSVVNSGGNSYKIAVTAAAPNSGCQWTITPSATATMDAYVRIDSAPSGIAGTAYSILHFDSAAPAAVSEVDLQTPGGVPQLALYNLNGGAALIQSPVVISTGAWYRVVLETTIGNGTGVLTMIVCTAANSCTTETQGSLSTGTSNIKFAQFQMFDASSITSTIHVDDFLLTNTAADPGQHEVLARQFTATGPTYTGWSAFGGSGCPANWNQTPFGTGQDCNNAIAGAGTCAGGATACQTGVTNFGITTGPGSTGFGAQTITGQTINAAKIVWVGQKNVGDANADSGVFIDSAAVETDVAGVAYANPAQTNAFQEVYLASAPTAAQILGAQAGIKHSAGTVRHDVWAVWLMADVAIPAASSNAGSVIVP